MATPALLLCLVIGITDGDTLTARCDAAQDRPAATLKIRLAETDAPEKGQPYGSRSREHLSTVCFGHRAEISQRGHDRYGRIVARVACAGVDASAEQVRAGMAWAFTKYLTDPGIRDLEDQAHAARRGLWADSYPIAPWDWRLARRSAQPLKVRLWRPCLHPVLQFSSFVASCCSNQNRGHQTPPRT